MGFWHTLSSHYYHADGSSVPGYKLELSGNKDRRDLSLCQRKETGLEEAREEQVSDTQK